MDIKVGKLRINLSALALYLHDDNPALGNWIASKSAPRTIYRWDCATQSGNPPQRLPIFEQQTAINFLMTWWGMVDRKASERLARHAVKAADLASVQAFDAELQRALPPLRAKIDWDLLWKPFKDDHSLRISAQVFWLQCVGRPYGMHVADSFYILVPAYVTFTTVITGLCGGSHPVGTAATGMSARRQTDERMEAFERQIFQEEEEAEGMNQRLIEDLKLEWGMNPSHGGLFDDDEEPENH